MRIGIDARMYGLEHAGIGRYVENLIAGLVKQNTKHELVFFLRQKNFSELSSRFRDPNLFFVKVEARHYSLKEQLIFPGLIAKNHIDLMHFPHFNVPFFYRGPFVVTIHDLLWHEMKGPKVTTLGTPLYQVKYLGYRLIVNQAVKRANKILVPSDWVRNVIRNEYKVNNDKIVTIYEGIDDAYLHDSKISQDTAFKIVSKYALKSPFIIYTGSFYPHKNLLTLLKAVNSINSRGRKLNLFIAGSRSVFRDRLLGEIAQLKMTNQVILPGFVSDENLRILYNLAFAFVFPSRSEGFGLPGLEAMASHCPVVASDNSSLPEIYGDAALYFNPNSPKELEEKLNLLLDNPSQRKRMIKKGKEVIKNYRWEKTARETWEVYESCLSL